MEGRHDDTQDDQDGGRGDYENNYDSDSDIEDDDDQRDEIEGRRKGPIYALFVYGGFSFDPMNMFFCSMPSAQPSIHRTNPALNSEAEMKPRKAPSLFPHPPLETPPPHYICHEVRCQSDYPFCFRLPPHPPPTFTRASPRIRRSNRG